MSKLLMPNELVHTSENILAIEHKKYLNKNFLKKLVWRCFPTPFKTM